MVSDSDFLDVLSVADNKLRLDIYGVARFSKLCRKAFERFRVDEHALEAEPSSSAEIKIEEDFETILVDRRQ